MFAGDAGTGSPRRPIRFASSRSATSSKRNRTTSAADSTPVTLPLAFNGIIGTPGDVDCFKFAARQGEVYEVECYARRVRSALDPVVNLYYADGRGLPATTTPAVRTVTSGVPSRPTASTSSALPIILGRGGPIHVYRIEFTTSRTAACHWGSPEWPDTGSTGSGLRRSGQSLRDSGTASLLGDFGGDLVLDRKTCRQALQWWPIRCRPA